MNTLNPMASMVLVSNLQAAGVKFHRGPGGGLCAMLPAGCGKIEAAIAAALTYPNPPKLHAGAAPACPDQAPPAAPAPASPAAVERQPFTPAQRAEYRAVLKAHIAKIQRRIEHGRATESERRELNALHEIYADLVEGKI